MSLVSISLGRDKGPPGGTLTAAGLSFVPVKERAHDNAWAAWWLPMSSHCARIMSLDMKKGPLRERFAAGLSCPLKEHLHDTAHAYRWLNVIAV